jgi:tetratricopeptide (TPR) repeat protein
MAAAAVNELQAEPAVAAATGELAPAASGDDAARYRARYRESLEGEQYAEAELAAKQLLDHLLAGRSEVPAGAADALSMLARVQRLMAQYDASLQNYQAAIGLIERSDDMLSSRLIEPLQGLAATYGDAGDYGEALRTYDRALHISHVNEGPHTIEQVHILSGMVDANLAADESKAALELIDRMNMLYERNYSPYALELLPALHRRAELLNRLGRHTEERSQYRRIERIMAAQYSADDPALIGPYLAIGRTYLHEASEVVFRSEPTTQNGETYFLRALAVAKANPKTSPELLADCLLALGDYYTVMNIIDKARLQYARAWEILSDEAVLGVRGRYLERPVPLRRLALSSYPDYNYGWSRADVDQAELLEGYIRARFTITDRGRVGDIEVIEAEPPGFPQMESRVRYGVKDFIYRPAHLDGVPVESSGILYRHDFYYRAEDISNGK